MSLLVLAAFVVTVQFIEDYLPLVLLFGGGSLLLSSYLWSVDRKFLAAVFNVVGVLVTTASVLVLLVKILASTVHFV